MLVVGRLCYFGSPSIARSSFFFSSNMYQDTFEEDDLIAEVELVAQARYSQNNDVDDKFDTEGMCACVYLSYIKLIFCQLFPIKQPILKFLTVSKTSFFNSIAMLWITMFTNFTMCMTVHSTN